MAQAASKGNCYLCGETISKTAFKKHLLEKHNDAAGDAQTCKLLKVEGADEKAYWLYLDMPVSATLKNARSVSAGYLAGMLWARKRIFCGEL